MNRHADDRSKARHALAAALTVAAVGGAWVYHAHTQQASLHAPEPLGTWPLAGEGYVEFRSSGELELFQKVQSAPTGHAAYRSVQTFALAFGLQGAREPLHNCKAALAGKTLTELLCEAGTPQSGGAVRVEIATGGQGGLLQLRGRTASGASQNEGSLELQTTTSSLARSSEATPHKITGQEARAADARTSLFVAGFGTVADKFHGDTDHAVFESEPTRETPEARLVLVGSSPQPIGAPTGNAPYSRPFAVALAVDVTPHSHATQQGPLPVSLAPIHAEDWLVLGEFADSEAMYESWLPHDGDTVTGTVTGSGTESTHVLLLDKDGEPQAIVRPRSDGSFRARATSRVTDLVATTGHNKSSKVLSRAGAERNLHVSRSGRVTVRIVDDERGTPLIARLLVRGIEGALDPQFGPDYRAAGAGPVVDTRGFVETELPAGRYRLVGTKGVFYTIDSEEVTVTEGSNTEVTLRLRRAIFEPGQVSCDLHVHSAHSPDSKVTVEDRVLSLLAAGVDFAVPTEHNAIGDYSAALRRLTLHEDLAWEPGVELTTFNPYQGHFGVFPFAHEAHAPAYEGVDVHREIKRIKSEDSNRMVVIHHPHLMPNMGYFDLHHFNPQTWEGVESVSFDFDGLEVMNGYELGQDTKIDENLEDWFSILRHGHPLVATGSSDSHRILYGWAGYPRTVALAGHELGKKPTNEDIVAALKSGHSYVTDGPVLAFSVGGKGPGDTYARPMGTASLPVHVRVSAAPWIDVRGFDVLADGKSVLHVATREIPLSFQERGKKASEISADSIRWEGDLDVSIPPGTTFVTLLAKGVRSLETVLPATPARPFAFTNPVWLEAPAP